MLSREYVNFLESLPCNRHARRRSRPVGAWLAGWVPAQQIAVTMFIDTQNVKRNIKTLSEKS